MRIKNKIVDKIRFSANCLHRFIASFPLSIQEAIKLS